MEVLDKDVWIDTDKDQGPSSCPHWPRHIVCLILKNTKTQKMQEFFISFYKDKPDSCMKTKIKLSQFWSLSIIRNCSNLEMPARVSLSTWCMGTLECRHPESRGRRNRILCWKHLRRKEGLSLSFIFTFPMVVSPIRKAFFTGPPCFLILSYVMRGPPESP